MTLAKLPAGMLRVIDLSAHQPPSTIDYSILSGEVDGVILRACYGTRRDKHFAEHVKRIRDNGIPLSAYCFFRHRPDMLEDAEGQAKAFLDTLSSVGWTAGDGVPWLDYEPNERWDGKWPGAEAYNDAAFSFKETVEAAMGDWGAYFAPGLWQGWMNSPVWMTERWIWLADYGESLSRTYDSAPPGKPRVKHYPLLQNWHIHQWGLEDYEATKGRDIDWDSNAAKQFPLLQLRPDEKTPKEPSKPYALQSDIAREVRVLADGFSRIAELIDGID